MPGVNDAPDAENDSKSVPPGGPSSDKIVLPNDTDPEGDALTVQEINGQMMPPTGLLTVTLPSGAVVMVNEEGDYTYDPNGVFDSLDVGETGADTFVYKISDGNGGMDYATVTLVLPGVNDAPDAEDDSRTTLPTDEVSGDAIDHTS